MTRLIVVTYSDGTPSMEFEMKGKWAMAAEARFPKFNTDKKITATYQSAYCAARALAGETRPFEVWADLVDFEVPDTPEADTGEAGAEAGSSVTSPPSPPTTTSHPAS